MEVFVASFIYPTNLVDFNPDQLIFLDKKINKKIEFCEHLL